MSRPIFTMEQLKYLERLFPAKEITPTSTMNEIQYQAGTQYVLNAVRRNTQGYRYAQVGGEK